MTIKALLKSDPVWGEAINALVMLVLGVFLLTPIDTFSLSVYRSMRLIMIEEYWGVLFLALGTLNLIGVVKDIRLFRKILALVMTFMWVMMAVSFIISLALGILAPIVICLAINSFFVFFQVGRFCRTHRRG